MAESIDGGTPAKLMSESTPRYPARVKARPSAPNVVVVLVDDMGYSDIGPFGSEIPTPHLDAIAADGYSLTNYHTSPVCSPSRAALLTGINPHRAGFGSVIHGDPGYANYRFTLPEHAPTIATTFRSNGYATFMVGKWHLTPEAEMHDGGDRRWWPLQNGFDRYFGSLDGFTTLFQPHRLIRDNSPVVDDRADAASYLTDVLTDEAIGMVRSLREAGSDKPFLLYFAHHAVHGPIQAKPEDMAAFDGVYAVGWDEVRAARLSRQQRLGITSPETTLPEPGPGEANLKWEDLDEELRRRYARHMQAYAGSVKSVDDSLGAMISCLKELGEYENTIIVFTSDNGGTAEGGVHGTRSYLSQFTWDPDLPNDWDRDADIDLSLIGGPQAMCHYPAGWARTSNTPFRLYKAHTYGGGVRAPLILSWPAGLPRPSGDDGIRRTFAFVTDVSQTLLDLAGARPFQAGDHQKPMSPDGVSFRDQLRDARSDRSRSEQYFEISGHRAFVSEGWKIVTEHKAGSTIDDSEWRLYNLLVDPTESTDRRSERPDIFDRLLKGWERAAVANGVYPLADDGQIMANHPDWHREFERATTLHPRQPTLERWRSAQLIQHRSFVIRARYRHEHGTCGVLGRVAKRLRVPRGRVLMCVA